MKLAIDRGHRGAGDLQALMRRGDHCMDKKEAGLQRRRELDRRRRSLESAEQREIRLSKRRERDRARRAERSSADRDRIARQRRNGLARETTAQRDNRLQRLRENRAERLEIETTEERQERLQELRDNQEQRIATETDEEREERLQALRNNQAQRLATETDGEREERLQVLRDNQAQRLATETDGERAERLQVLRDNTAQRLAAETDGERDERLQALRDNQAQRLATETDGEREERLQVLRDNQAQRLATETDGDRFNRLQQLRENHSLRVAQEDEPDSARRRQQNADTQRRLRDLQRQRPHTALTRAQAKMATFHSKLASLEFSKCTVCLERYHVKKTPSVSLNTDKVCTRCKRDKHTPKIYSSENSMDPGPVPPELSGLTQVEEMLISAVMPMMSVYRLPYGQYGYSGHVINFPQDVLSFATTLPRLPSQLDVVVVRKEGVGHSPHRDFRVRRHVVERALRYLLANNKYYLTRNVQIDEDTLAQLPEDGSLSDFLPVVINNSESPDQDTRENESAAMPITGENDTAQAEPVPREELARSFIPNVTRQLTEQ